MKCYVPHYTPFCLHPHTNTLLVLALDYIIAVYPLLLIALSYLLVLLYDRNVRFIVCLWKPFVPLFIRFRRQWNIKSSLVDAFATFLLLSYVKIVCGHPDACSDLRPEWPHIVTALSVQPGRCCLPGQPAPATCLSGSLLSLHLHTDANAAALPPVSRSVSTAQAATINHYTSSWMSSRVLQASGYPQTH